MLKQLCIQRIQRKPRIERTIPRATVIRVQTCSDKQKLHLGLREITPCVGVAGRGGAREQFMGVAYEMAMKHKN